MLEKIDEAIAAGGKVKLYIPVVMITRWLLEKMHRLDLALRLHVEANREADFSQEQFKSAADDCIVAMISAGLPIEKLGNTYYYVWRNLEDDPPLKVLKDCVATSILKRITSGGCTCGQCKVD